WATGTDGRQQFEDETSEPARHRRAGSRTTSRLLLRDGSDHRANPPTFRRRRHLLERSSAMQHRADASGAGCEKGRRRSRRRAESAAPPGAFCRLAVTDGIAMGPAGMKASLPSREVIAASVELTVRGPAYDARIGLAGCDKSQPAMMMAMCRLNVPAIYIY